MDESKALSIVSALANGVNPLTGEVFPSDSPYQAPDVVRALFVAARVLEQSSPPSAPGDPARTTKRASNLPSNVGKPWTSEEDKRLLEEFDRGCSLRALANSHGRTLAGVEARLEKHGRLQPGQRTTSNRYGDGAGRGPQDRKPSHA